MRHYPYRRVEKSHFLRDPRPGSAIDAAWESGKVDKRIADIEKRHRTGELPYIDPRQNHQGAYY